VVVKDIFTYKDWESEQYLKQVWESTHDGHILHQFPQWHRVDFFIEFNKHLVGYIEVKSRSYILSKLETVYLDESKYDYMLALSKLDKVPAYYVSGWRCGSVISVPINDDLEFERRMGGFKKRGDKDKPLIDIPKYQFELIKEANIGQETKKEEG